MTATPTGTPPGSTVPGVAVRPIPTRELLPPTWLGAGVLAGTVAALAASLTRPARLPEAAQRAADGVTLTVAALHPFEAAAMRRYCRRAGVPPATRRDATLATLVFGAFSAPYIRRACRRAPS